MNIQTWSYPINPSNFLNRTDWPEQPGKWANIDIQELMYWMRYVYEHREEAQLKGKIASRMISQEYSWPKCAQDMVELLNTL